ncbi:hypothetical protein ADUPG1_008326 [Aduncisulcus paluster]|uniref:Uncharacterized protein n=1 Tax=Aduncisulcus paluster TaxID=2918883 RepID=A0ABQ5KU15_9EUKA|nr:hypothetical protein ADUPG1_008326 [Aduncisulcus paluster]
MSHPKVISPSNLSISFDGVEGNEDDLFSIFEGNVPYQDQELQFHSIDISFCAPTSLDKLQIEFVYEIPRKLKFVFYSAEKKKIVCQSSIPNEEGGFSFDIHQNNVLRFSIICEEDWSYHSPRTPSYCKASKIRLFSSTSSKQMVCKKHLKSPSKSSSIIDAIWTKRKISEGSIIPVDSPLTLNIWDSFIGNDMNIFGSCANRCHNIREKLQSRSPISFYSLCIPLVHLSEAVSIDSIHLLSEYENFMNLPKIIDIEFVLCNREVVVKSYKFKYTKASSWFILPVKLKNVIGIKLTVIDTWSGLRWCTIHTLQIIKYSSPKVKADLSSYMEAIKEFDKKATQTRWTESDILPTEPRTSPSLVVRDNAHLRGSLISFDDSPVHSSHRTHPRSSHISTPIFLDRSGESVYRVFEESSSNFSFYSIHIPLLFPQDIDSIFIYVSGDTFSPPRHCSITFTIKNEHESQHDSSSLITKSFSFPKKNAGGYFELPVHLSDVTCCDFQTIRSWDSYPWSSICGIQIELSEEMFLKFAEKFDSEMKQRAMRAIMAEWTHKEAYSYLNSEESAEYPPPIPWTSPLLVSINRSECSAFVYRDLSHTIPLCFSGLNHISFYTLRLPFATAPCHVSSIFMAVAESHSVPRYLDVNIITNEGAIIPFEVTFDEEHISSWFSINIMVKNVVEIEFICIQSRSGMKWCSLSGIQVLSAPEEEIQESKRTIDLKSQDRIDKRELEVKNSLSEQYQKIWEEKEEEK